MLLPFLADQLLWHLAIQLLHDQPETGQLPQFNMQQRRQINTKVCGYVPTGACSLTGTAEGHTGDPTKSSQNT